MTNMYVGFTGCKALSYHLFRVAKNCKKLKSHANCLDLPLVYHSRKKTPRMIHPSFTVPTAKCTHYTYTTQTLNIS